MLSLVFIYAGVLMGFGLGSINNWKKRLANVVVPAVNVVYQRFPEHVLKTPDGPQWAVGNSPRERAAARRKLMVNK